MARDAPSDKAHEQAYPPTTPGQWVQTAGAGQPSDRRSFEVLIDQLKVCVRPVPTTSEFADTTFSDVIAQRLRRLDP